MVSCPCRPVRASYSKSIRLIWAKRKWFRSSAEPGQTQAKISVGAMKLRCAFRPDQGQAGRSTPSPARPRVGKMNKFLCVFAFGGGSICEIPISIEVFDRRTVSEKNFPCRGVPDPNDTKSTPCSVDRVRIGFRWGVLFGRNRSEDDSRIVLDRQGNVAAIVHSINSVLWGTMGIAVDGIPASDPAFSSAY